jgi:hypothetical protein
MYIGVSVCVCMCLYVCMCVCMYVCVYICMCVYIYVYRTTKTRRGTYLQCCYTSIMLYTICIPYVYHMYTICIPYVYHMYTICIPYVYHMYTICCIKPSSLYHIPHTIPSIPRYHYTTMPQGQGECISAAEPIISILIYLLNPSYLY